MLTKLTCTAIFVVFAFIFSFFMLTDASACAVYSERLQCSFRGLGIFSSGARAFCLWPLHTLFLFHFYVGKHYFESIG